MRAIRRAQSRNWPSRTVFRSFRSPGRNVGQDSEKYSFSLEGCGSAGAYKDVAETPTLAVAAQWVTSAKQPDDLIYNITKGSLERGYTQGTRCGPCEGQAHQAR
ncbi:TAXI family TRAP transporter solute-binding subunit [Brucella abortus]|nr:TAXI family TRAP transporter solute-binding subunit [Brucella abortus]